MQLLLKDDTEQTFTRLTVQPKCIKFGTMRPYQLSGVLWLFPFVVVVW